MESITLTDLAEPAFGILFFMRKRLDVVAALKQQLTEAQSNVDRLRRAISVLEGLGRNKTRPTHKVSAAGRRRIAAAQRKRWAKLKRIKKH